MGFYDYRCMLSGLSLSASRVALVLLEKHDDRYLPAALPVFGQYNRSGAIDLIAEDELTDRLLAFFQSHIATGAIVIDWSEVYWEGAFLTGIANVEQLLAAVERGVTMDYDCVTLYDRRSAFSLIDLRIWDALSHAATGAAYTGRSATWNALYAFPVAGFEASLRELNQVENFMQRYGISWMPPENPGQHFREETDAYIDEARTRFADEQLILQGIAAYEEAMP